MLSFQLLTRSYKELSSLYKNPAKPLGGQAAALEEKELKKKHAELQRQFDERAWSGAELASAWYVKILALLYEVDDYYGITPRVQNSILAEAESVSQYFQTPQSLAALSETNDFRDDETRSLWKARVTCCVGAIETKRKRQRDHNYEAIKDDLNNLKTFVEMHLHRPELKRFAWTTLAMVRMAQARLARQNQQYGYMREELLEAAHCLDQRAEEIIRRLSELHREPRKTAKMKAEIEELDDDLVFIRQKQTLSISFNVGLAELQRGFLRSADYACQAATLQFRLHGHFYHRKFNDLVLLSIRRARTPGNDRNEFRLLQAQLKDILRCLEPSDTSGNPKLYLYALRELAVIQIYRRECDEALKTLEKMEGLQSVGQQWSARIYNLRARACYHGWNLSRQKAENSSLLDQALDFADISFKQAAVLDKGIQSYATWRTLLSRIENSTNKNLIDTIESLVTYATVQLFRQNPQQAIKCARVIIELCGKDNPRLHAMGHLVMAEAQTQEGQHVEAERHLANAKILEKKTDHRYVEDRRRAVERQMPQHLDLTGISFKDAKREHLMGWYIERRSNKGNLHQIGTEIGVNRNVVVDYLKSLEPTSPYYHLKSLLQKRGTPGRKKQRKTQKSTTIRNS